MTRNIHTTLSIATFITLSTLTLAGLAGIGPFAISWLAGFFAFASWGVIEVAIADLVRRNNDSFVYSAPATTIRFTAPSTDRMAA